MQSELVAFAVVKKKGQGVIGLKLIQVPEFRVLGIMSLSDIVLANMKIYNVSIEVKRHKTGKVAYTAVGTHGDISRYPVVDSDNRPVFTRAMTIVAETAVKGTRMKTVWCGTTSKEVPEEVIKKGYYVASHNGYVGYISSEQTLLLGSRYTLANAVLRGTTIAPLNLTGVTKPFFLQAAPPVGSSRVIKADSEKFLQQGEEDAISRAANIQAHSKETGEVVLSDKQMHKLRVLADTVGNDQLCALVTKDENTFIQRAYERALIWGTLPNKAIDVVDVLYEKLCKTDASVIQMLNLSSDSLVAADAFQSMLGTLRSPVDKFFALKTYADLSAQAKSVYCNALKTEPEVTGILTKMASRLNYSMGGLEFRIKSPGSFVEKVYERSRLEGKSNKAALATLKDLLRYTVIYKCTDTEDNYVANSTILCSMFKSGLNYRMASFRNYWIVTTNPYNGVNTAYITDCSAFELQIHTPESFDLKNGALHTMYEESRAVGVSPERKAELNRQMHALSDALRRPRGIENFNLGEWNEIF